MGLLEAIAKEISVPVITYNNLVFSGWGLLLSKNSSAIVHQTKLVNNSVSFIGSEPMLRSSFLSSISETDETLDKCYELAEQVQIEEEPKPLLICRVGLYDNYIMLLSTFFTFYRVDQELYQQTIFDSLHTIDVSDIKFHKKIIKLNKCFELLTTNYYDIDLLQLNDFKRVRRFLYP